MNQFCRTDFPDFLIFRTKEPNNGIQTGNKLTATDGFTKNEAIEDSFTRGLESRCWIRSIGLKLSS
jgi:hypothetical protein